MTTTCSLAALSGKWKLDILYALSQGMLRWSSLTTLLPEAAPNVLTRQLRALVADGLVFRVSLTDRPPLTVAYGLTEEGKKLIPTLERLAQWDRCYGMAW